MTARLPKTADQAGDHRWESRWERSTFAPEFRRWFSGSWVTHDGTPNGQPIMVFRGCSAGEDRASTCRDRTLTADSAHDQDIYWLTSSRLNASFFEDGELQNAFVRLVNPLVLTEREFRESGATPFRIAEDARAQVKLGLANWDGVIFEDIVDGSHPSTVYAVFPHGGSVAHAVRVVGRTTYDDDGMAVFTGLQPSDSPVSFGRLDEIGRNAATTTMRRPRGVPDRRFGSGRWLGR